MYRYGDRNQMMLMPASIEDYVTKDDPVRAYDGFVEAMDFKELGIEINPNKVGNSSYYPKTMLKLLLYGYAYGVRSSRKLERETKHNLSFIWLMKGLSPDHKTIAEFRRKNKPALKKALKQCARLCIDFGLMDGNTLFVDGTKINADAGIKSNWNKERCLKSLQHIDKRIEAILRECEQTDQAEQDKSSYVHMKEELADAETFKVKVKGILKQIEQEQKTHINTTDPQARQMNSIKGGHPGYNAQLVVDQKHGLIVSADITDESSDINQFAKQIEQANTALNKPCKVACADKGYCNTADMEKVAQENITVIVAPPEGKPTKKELTYDSRNDCFICPKGKRLIPKGLSSDRKSKVYRIEHVRDCQACKLCTKAKYGRVTSRLLGEDARQKFIADYKSSPGQDIYQLRRQKVELPFGHIKRNLKGDSFLLRGKEGAHAEFSLFSCCFNIARMITLLGVTGLVAKLAT